MHATQRELSRIKDDNSRILREDIRARAVVFRALPEILSLYITDRCNLECIMCPRSLSPGHHTLDRSVVENICAELLPTARKVALAGAAGEPLLGHYDLILEYAKRYQVKIDMFTNGTMMTRECYRRSRDHLDVLNISLDAHRPEVYAHIRRGLPFDRVRGNLEGIKAERAARGDDVLIILSMVIMSSNVRLLPEFVRFAHEMAADAVVCQKLLQVEKHRPEELPERDPGPEAMRLIFDRAKEVAREIGMNLFMGEFGDSGVYSRPLRRRTAEPLEGPQLCWYVAQNFGVMYNGDVYPCCFPTDFRYGNLREQDPRSIWNSRQVQRLREAQYRGRGTIFCSDCFHGPHLPKKRPKALFDLARRFRMKRLQLSDRWKRWRQREP